MKRAISLLIVLVLCAGLFAFPVSAEDADDFGFDLELSSRNAMLLNLDTGTVIFEKDADERVHPASTTKIMAVALAMTLCDDLDGTIVTIPDGVWNEFQGMDISHAGLVVGEQISMKELLYCMMLQSANEAAVALANYYGRDNFIQMMNDKARELGCTNTHFNNPHGAFVADHYTSARDMMIITQWALTVPGFWEMSQLARYTKSATNKNEPVTLATTILMQDSTSRYYVNYIKGIKTGTLDEAGRCLVSAAQKDGVTYLLVVLGGSFTNSDLVWPDGNTSYTDTYRIYEWAFKNLALENVIDTTTIVDEIPLRFAAKRDAILLYPDGELYAVRRTGVEEQPALRYEYELPERLTAPVTAGDVIATAKVYYGERYIGEINLVPRESVERNGIAVIVDTTADILTSTGAKIVYVVLLLVVLFYLYYVLIVVPRARKKSRKKRTGTTKKR